MLSEDLVDAIGTYLEAPTLHEARRVLETSPELIGPGPSGLAVDAMLLEMVRKFGVHSKVADHIRVRASLLVRSRQLGIAEAFVDAKPTDGQEPNEPSREDETERLTGEHSDSLQLLARLRLMDPETWASMQADAGNRLLTSASGNPADNVEAAIRHYHAALEVRTLDRTPRGWAATMHNMGRAFSLRVHGDPEENIAAAISSYEAALTVTSSQQTPAEWAETTCWLAAACAAQRSGDRTWTLGRAFALLEHVLRLGLAETVPNDWATAMRRLIEACHAATRDGPQDYAETVMAIYWSFLELEERRLRACNAGMAGVAARDMVLACIMRLKRDVTRRPEDALRVYGTGSNIIAPEQAPVTWAIVLNHLGIAHDLSQGGSRADNLEHAVGAYRTALDTLGAEDEPLIWAELQFNLGMAWFERIRGDRAENMECCIAAYEMAAEVNLRKGRLEYWSDTQTQLGLAYLERIRGERPFNLEKAIAFFLEAEKVLTREAWGGRWGNVMHNLCTAYRNRVFGDPVENARLAIKYGEAALSVTSREQMPIEWAKTKANLGLAYVEAAPGAAASQQAIAALQEALDAVDPGTEPRTWGQIVYDLAEAYARSADGNQRGCFGQAVRHYRLAIDVFSEWVSPVQRHVAQRSLANFLFRKRRWRDAEAAYAAAAATAETLLHEAYTDDGRIDRLAGMWRSVSRHACCLLRMGQPGEAFLRLEQGKGRLLAEALALGDSELVDMPEARRTAVRDLRREIRELEAEMRARPDAAARRSDRDLAEALRGARARLRAVLEDDGGRLTGPAAGLDLPTLLGLIPEGGALVAPVLTPEQGAVLILPHGAQAVGMEHVLWLPGATDDKLAELVREWFGAYAGYAHVSGHSHAARAAWFDTVEAALGRLWRVLMGPVHARLSRLSLRKHAPVVLMPQGRLGLFPLHAAHRAVRGRRRCVLDDWTVSYAPSGYALLAGSRRLGEAKRQGRTLLAVIDPTGDLPFTPMEGDAVAALFDPSARALLRGETATRDAVVQAIGKHTYLHFSCHGAHAWLEPMQSALLLAGGKRLTLADILGPEFDLGAARLVVLSACETGLTEIRHAPDEFIGLPAGFLQAGAPSVVATLWPVDDLSTSLLLEKFYRCHLGDGLPPAAALRAAQLWLRDGSAEQLNLAQRWAQVHRCTADPDLAAEAFLRSEYYAQHPKARPFTHPHHWAAFSVVGA